MLLSNKNIDVVYYKSIDLFVLVFDAEKPESLEKLERSYENIQNIQQEHANQAILVAMHNKKKVKKINYLLLGFSTFF